MAGPYVQDLTGFPGCPIRRTVEWRAHLPRTHSSRDVLDEIGSAMSLFQIRWSAIRSCPPAGAFAKSRSNLRLVDGDEPVVLILAPYDALDSHSEWRLPARGRPRTPLVQIVHRNPVRRHTLLENEPVQDPADC